MTGSFAHAAATSAPKRLESAGRREPVNAGAQLLVLLLCLAALAATVGAGYAGSPRETEWSTFAILAAAAAFAQLFGVVTPRNQSYHLAIVFVLAGALLLPPELVAPLCVFQHLPEWARDRLQVEIQTFNIANYTLAGLGGSVAAREILGSAAAGGDSRTLVAGVAAGAVFVLINHGLLAGMLRVARGHSLRQSGLFTVESLTTDLVLALIGVGLAAWWNVDPWFLPVAIAPLVLVHRALAIPSLRAEVNREPKTGLFNAAYLNSALEKETARAVRFERPLSVIVADLDLLRKINNRHGHLTGDAVLVGVADILRAQLRPYDVAARFGGEEFAVVLPETDFDEAVAIAERIRAAVAEGPFHRHGSDDQVFATISMGVASYPRHAGGSEELVHQADLALYRAKALGRNRVCGATAELRTLNELILGAGRGGAPARRKRGFRPYGSRRPDDTVRRRLDRTPRRPVEEVREADEELFGPDPDVEASTPTQLATIAALSRSMEARGHEGGNAEHVAALAVAIAHALGYRGDELEAIRIGGLVHDIGRIGIPQSITSKAGPLSEDEWTRIREHPVISDYILSGVDMHPFVRQIAHSGHERIDGRGYPDGLAGAEIPLPARIMLVADAFEALTSDRPYRPRRSTDEALDEIHAHTGTQFCPVVVEALDRLRAERPWLLDSEPAEPARTAVG